MSRPLCLTVGGSDSCGGAGIQADLRIFESMDVDGCSVTTALTAQNFQQVLRVEAVSLAQMEAELYALFDCYHVDVVKTGMLLDADHVGLLAGVLPQLHRGAIVIDPVICSSSGRRLLDQGGVDALMQGLLPQATLWTPNLDEAAALLGRGVEDPEQCVRQLYEDFQRPVLLKGGHGEGDMLCDYLCDEHGELHRYTHPRQAWNAKQRHGTGCRLASAIAARLALGDAMGVAVGHAVDALQSKLR